MVLAKIVNMLSQLIAINFSKDEHGNIIIRTSDLMPGDWVGQPAPVDESASISGFEAYAAARWR